MSSACDIAVVGSGYAGSIIAMVARRLGRSVVLIERGRHPRTVIGESSTPLSNLLLEEIATTYDLPALLPLTKWGTWQRTYPNLACGLKRGFTFFHHGASEAVRSNQLFVEASPHDGIADTHWFRADFDHFLLTEAKRLGAVYLDETKLDRFTEVEEGVLLEGSRCGTPVAVTARFVLDATGPRGFLHRALGLAEAPLPGYPQTYTLYNHFSGVGRLGSHERGMSSPYPPEDAAVHHLFEGGWVWVLRFNNGITSAGVAATSEAADRFRLHEGEAAWPRLLDSIPALKSQFARAQPQGAFTYSSRLSFRSSTMTGARWAMLPSAAGFVDPLFSTGFPLALLGIGRLATILDQHWCRPTLPTALAGYARITDADLLATARLIGALYANMGNFAAFRDLSLLYFAAASFSETARRLDRPQLAPSFLLHSHPVLGPQIRNLLERAADGIDLQHFKALHNEVLRIIQPIDIAGLSDPTRVTSYPVLAQDLYNSCAKLHAAPDEITAMLDRAGFYLPV